LEGWLAAPCPPGPLQGVRVLDLSRVMAGPYASMILGDLGADVIKVEQLSGDETRRWGPPFVGSTAAYYFSANRNKRSIVLDLKQDGDRRVARELAKRADVVIENFMPGAAQRFGLAYEDLQADNPSCVYCSVSGFGHGTPLERRKGYDLLMQAIGGMMSVTGQEDGPPAKVGVPISDLAAGLFGAIGVLGALVDRERTGRGRHVEIALLDAQVALLSNQAMNWLLAGLNPTRMGSDHPNVAPYGSFRTRTIAIVVGAGTDAQFQDLCRALHRESWITDPRFATNSARVANRQELRGELQDVLAEQPAAHWLKVLDHAGVVCGPIRSVPEVFEDPHVRDRMVASAPHPELGMVEQVVSPIRFDGQKAAVGQAPPPLGAHTDAIRRHLERVLTQEGRTIA
jgi:crotonobetainyl-CoA:carnitine CoA-transferase CaiB-like acyl-CoA transferase